MHAIKRTSACTITPDEIPATVTRYNANGWVVTDIWRVSDKRQEVCLNAIYKAGTVSAEEQARFSETHTWRKE